MSTSQVCPGRWHLVRGARIWSTYWGLSARNKTFGLRAGAHCERHPLWNSTREVAWRPGFTECSWVDVSDCWLVETVPLRRFFFFDFWFFFLDKKKLHMKYSICKIQKSRINKCFFSSPLWSCIKESWPVLGRGTACGSVGEVLRVGVLIPGKSLLTLQNSQVLHRPHLAWGNSGARSGLVFPKYHGIFFVNAYNKVE